MKFERLTPKTPWPVEKTQARIDVVVEEIAEYNREMNLLDRGFRRIANRKKEIQAKLRNKWTYKRQLDAQLVETIKGTKIAYSQFLATEEALRQAKQMYESGQVKVNYSPTPACASANNVTIIQMCTQCHKPKANVSNNWGFCGCECDQKEQSEQRVETKAEWNSLSKKKEPWEQWTEPEVIDILIKKIIGIQKELNNLHAKYDKLISLAKWSDASKSTKC